MREPDDVTLPDGEARGEPPVWTGDSARAAAECELVLSAMDIESRRRAQDDHIEVLVGDQDRERALEELRLYAQENPPGVADGPRATPADQAGVIGGMLALILMLAGATVQMRGAHGENVTLGILDAARLRAGEWWRGFTALSLHADVFHFLSNFVFGGLIVGLVCEVFGAGLGLFAVILSGGAANVASFALRDPGARGLGASTAVFAALGLLAGRSLAAPRKSGRGRLEQAAPAVAALGLLALFGAGTARTDVLGHVMGFAVGTGAGAVLERMRGRMRANVRAQRVFMLGALGLAVGPWVWAFIAG
jgi:rhomboid protease GluP